MADPKKDAPVPAREELNRLDEKQADPKKGLEAQAKEQEKAQKEQLAAGKGAPKGEHDKLIKEGNVSGARAVGYLQDRKPDAVDNFSRRSAQDAMQGHFVEIDLNHKGVEEGYKAAGLEGHSGQFGVFTAVGEVDEKTGYPVTVNVRLRDASHANVVVPYEACRNTDRVSR